MRASVVIWSVVVFMSAAPLPAPPQDEAPEKVTERTVRRSVNAPVPEATVDDMAWLAGHWCGEGLGGRVEEMWSAPDAGAMMGMFRLVRDDKPVFYEFLTIRETDRGLAMQLKHVNPDMSTWEEREKFTEFLYVGADGPFVRFEGLTYDRSRKDRLTVYLAIGAKDGAREETFRIRRCGP